MEWFLGFIDPVLDTVVTAIVGVVVGWIGVMAHRFLGITLEQRHRDALQTTLTNAAGLVLAKIGRNQTISPRDVKNAGGVEYVEKGSPDALANFDLTGKEDEIAEKIIAKISQVTDVVPKANPKRGGAAI